MKSKLWTKYFILLTAVTFFMGISTSMLNSPLPMYVKHLGSGDSVAGLATALFSLSSLIFRPLFGNMLDNWGRKVVLIVGIIAYGTIVVSYNWIAVVAGLLILRFLQGIGFSAYSTASGTVASDLVPADRLVEGIGYYGMFQTAAMAVGPSVGLALVASSSYRGLFLISFSLAVAGLIPALFLNYEKESKSLLKPEEKRQDMNKLVAAKPANRSKGEGRMKNGVFEKTALPVSTAAFFVTLTSGTVMTFLPACAFSRGIKSIGAYFTISAAAVLIARFVSGRMVARFDISKVIPAGLALSATALLLLSFASTLSMFMAAAVLSGLGTGIVFPVFNSLVIKFSPKERRGAANATYYSAFDIGIGLGSIAGGFIAQYSGYSFLYLLSAFCIAISYMIYFFFIRNKSMSGKPDHGSNESHDIRLDASGTSAKEYAGGAD